MPVRAPAKTLRLMSALISDLKVVRSEGTFKTGVFWMRPVNLSVFGGRWRMRKSLRREAHFVAGEVVEVRSQREMLASLDRDGKLDGLPLMPEMLQYSGRRFRVFRSAHKTCDTICKTGGRRMARAVHLENLRCDGTAHGGCQAGCLLFWKEAWLRRVGEAPELDESAPGVEKEVCTEEGLHQSVRLQEIEGEEERYVCQATELFRATRPLRWWDPRQYVQDVVTGNVNVIRLVWVLLLATWNAVQRRRGGRTCPRSAVGTLRSTPALKLDLQPGEQVQVRSREEIAATLDVNSKNRGLWFDIEMIPFCGGTFSVLRRVEMIINERTGRMTRLPGDCIVLDGVSCGGELSRMRLFCPRSIYPYWREIWLRRVDARMGVEPAKPEGGRQGV